MKTLIILSVLISSLTACTPKINHAESSETEYSSNALSFCETYSDCETDNFTDSCVVYRAKCTK